MTVVTATPCDDDKHGSNSLHHSPSAAAFTAPFPGLVQACTQERDHCSAALRYPNGGKKRPCSCAAFTRQNPRHGLHASPPTRCLTPSGHWEDQGGDIQRVRSKPHAPGNDPCVRAQPRGSAGLTSPQPHAAMLGAWPRSGLRHRDRLSPPSAIVSSHRGSPFRPHAGPHSLSGSLSLSRFPGPIPFPQARAGATRENHRPADVTPFQNIPPETPTLLTGAPGQ